MMGDLKPCIRCGGHMSWNDNEFESAYVCDDCHYFVEWDGTPEEFVKWWNTRPIEDALNKRIAELEKDNDEFRQLIHDWIIILTPDDGYVPDSECNDVATPIDVALRKRIAELEGKIDQLTAHSDIERQVEPDWQTRIESAQRELQAYVAELEPRWIPVSERMPDNWESVLTIDISKSTRDMVTAFYNPETSLWSTHVSCDLWVTHWMPLPEPPIVYGKEDSEVQE